MKIIFFTHPDFMSSQSMPRFAAMLYEEMEQRGHSIKVWSPLAKYYNISTSLFLKKWLGYIDQYILFPISVKKQLKEVTPDTLFVFTDNALGPWVPLVANRPHVIHCHDFLAQQSALNQIKENPTSWTGKHYQAYIRWGYQKGKNFISVSNKTRTDLHQLLGFQPYLSEVVYNGMNNQFTIIDVKQARTTLGSRTGLELGNGYLLHVGGNQWYKNRRGVIDIYDAWRSTSQQRLSLIMIGQEATHELETRRLESPFREDIHFLTGMTNQLVQLAYAGASVFLFPSLAEGFGWPIAEAMASGCPVITTDEAPMTEVAGEAAFFIPRMPSNQEAARKWAMVAAQVIEAVITLTSHEREKTIRAGLENVKRFDSSVYTDKIEQVYQIIIANYSNTTI